MKAKVFGKIFLFLTFVMPLKMEDTSNQSHFINLFNDVNGMILTKTSSENISDGVYYIRLADNQNLAFNIPYADYSLGNNVITYSFYDDVNERFLIEKQGSDTYTIKPLATYNENKVLSVSVPEDNNNLMITTKGPYDEYNFSKDKFKFELQNDGSYKIYSGISNYTKLLGTLNDTPANNTRIVLKNSNVVDTKNKFNLYMTDDIATGVEKKVEIKKNSSVTLYIQEKSYAVGEYSLKLFCTNKREGKITLKQNNNSTVGSSRVLNDGNLICSMNFNFYENNDEYSVVLQNISNYDDTFYFVMEPKNEASLIGTFDWNSNKHDRSSELNIIGENLVDEGFSCKLYHNVGKNILLENYDLEGFKSPLQKNLVVFRGHGGRTGIQTYNDKIIESIEMNELPNMEDVDIAIWGGCKTAERINNDNSNFTYKAYENGAGTSIGWPRDVSTIAASYYIESFLKGRYELEKSISDSLTYASDRFWARYFILMGQDLFKCLVEPVVYSRDEIITYPSASHVSSSVNSKYLEIQDIFFKENIRTINDFLVINGVYTDILKTEASLFRKEIEMIKPYLSNDCIVLKNNMKLKVLKIIFDESTQSVRALDVISGQQHSETELLSMVRPIYEY